MTTCILNHPGCEGQTNGSIGAARIKWSFICQNCKDIEDDCVNGLLTSQTRVVNVVIDQLSMPTQTLETIA